MSDSAEKFFYFLLGGVVVAVTALLVAPQSGKETREMIAGKAKEGTEYVTAKTRKVADLANSASRNLQNQAAEFIDRGVDVLSRQREQLTAAVEAGKQVYREEKAKLREQE